MKTEYTLSVTFTPEEYEALKSVFNTPRKEKLQKEVKKVILSKRGSYKFAPKLVRKANPEFFSDTKKRKLKRVGRYIEEKYIDTGIVNRYYINDDYRLVIVSNS